VAGSGSGLVAATPVGPSEPVGRVVDALGNEGDEQAAISLQVSGINVSGAVRRVCSSARTTARKVWASMARVTQRVQEV
jgi:hypothetical protein